METTNQHIHPLPLTQLIIVVLLWLIIASQYFSTAFVQCILVKSSLGSLIPLSEVQAQEKLEIFSK